MTPRHPQSPSRPVVRSAPASWRHAGVRLLALQPSVYPLWPAPQQCGARRVGSGLFSWARPDKPADTSPRDAALTGLDPESAGPLERACMCGPNPDLCLELATGLCELRHGSRRNGSRFRSGTYEQCASGDPRAHPNGSAVKRVRHSHSTCTTLEGTALHIALEALGLDKQLLPVVEDHPVPDGLCASV